MKPISLPFGQSNIQFNFPSETNFEIFSPKIIKPAENPLAKVRAAVQNPLPGSGFSHLCKGKKVAIAINDKTRPVPHEHLLPPLLEKIEQCGVLRKDITLLIASGTHIPMPEIEFSRILPQSIIDQYQILAHDCDDEQNLEYVGETQRGTPIWVNKTFYDADFRIVVGNIEPHHFMGFSGGVKSGSIGLTGRETITKNHSMLLDKNASIGIYEENPMRQDIEEIGQIINIHLALNSIMNQEKKIVEVVCGDPISVMKAGIPISRRVCQLDIPQRYDLVIASVGGKPKDINLYQSQKALTHASQITNDNGVVILVAECPEGSGSAGYEEFMKDIHCYQDVFEKFKKTGFHVGPHKALQFARELKRIHVILLSKMDPELVKKLLLIPASTAQESLKLANELLPQNSSMAILPFATNTLPNLSNKH